MRKGYVLLDPSNDYQKGDIEKMRAVGCEKIFVDDIADEESRPQYCKMRGGLKYGDEVVFISFCNAVRGTRGLASFFEDCRVKKARLISLDDQVDSKNEMFTSSASQLMNAIATLQGDVIAIRMANKRSHVKKKSEISGNKVLRNQRCIALYRNGSSIEDIKKETGFSSKSSIFRVLKEAGVKLERRNRKRKTE